MKKWYESKIIDTHQGLVIEEGTGRNVAVTYDKADATLVAAAPEMLEVLETLVRRIERDNLHTTHGLGVCDARVVIAQARERE